MIEGWLSDRIGGEIGLGERSSGTTSGIITLAIGGLECDRIWPLLRIFLGVLEEGGGRGDWSTWWWGISELIDDEDELKSIVATGW